jgi:hypothetical protein
MILKPILVEISLSSGSNAVEELGLTTASQWGSYSPYLGKDYFGHWDLDTFSAQFNRGLLGFLSLGYFAPDYGPVGRFYDSDSSYDAARKTWENNYLELYKFDPRRKDFASTSGEGRLYRCSLPITSSTVKWRVKP